VPRKTILIPILLLAFLSALLLFAKLLPGSVFQEGFRRVAFWKPAATTAGSGQSALRPESESLNRVETGPRTESAASAADSAAAAAAEQPERPALSEADFSRSQSPVAGQPAVGYGQGYSKTYEDYRFHGGGDFTAPVGTAIQAVLDGRVSSISTDVEWGTTVSVDHGDGWVTRYCGCQGVVVETGDKVKAGQVLAEVGNPGLIEVGLGPHLHFEIRHGEEVLDPLRLGIRLRSGEDN
jgi:murein DD-endopeptidase MepM/ murein hydrolase activator NlpD